MAKERDWLDDFIDEMSDEEKAELEKDDRRFFWSPADEELYCWDNGKPTSWSVKDQKWVPDPECVDVLLGESFGKSIDEKQAEEYKEYLNKKYGKKVEDEMVTYEPKPGKEPISLDGDDRFIL